MSRGSSRKRPRRELEELELAQKKVRELEEQLQQKNILLAKDAKKLKQKYGFNVDASSSYSSASEEQNSPFFVGSSSGRSDDSTPNRIDKLDRYRDNSLPQNNHPNADYSRPEYYEPPTTSSDYLYEHPPDHEGFEEVPPQRFYREEIDVRVDEMPRWPMEDSPEPERRHLVPERAQSYSPTPAWRHQQDVRVDPMPVFPMEGDDQELVAAMKRREEKVRLQMMMIAQQAQRAEAVPKSVRFDSKSKDRSDADKERAEKRKARHTISKIRDEVVKEMEQKKRKEENERRDAEREKRHALKRKKEEEEREIRRKEMKQAEYDEYFIKYLEPAIGKINFTTTRIEGKSPLEYITKFYTVNIPKELLYGSKVGDMKGECYRGAVLNYVDKLVSLGVLDTNTRKLMKRSQKLPKFLAELVEPLCNDIAIFGTQISVTDARDMRGNFEKFAKEKSFEFWSSEENKSKLSDSLKSYGKKRSRSRSRSPSRDRYKSASDKDRKSSREEDRPQKTSSPSNEESLKLLFATVGNGIDSGVPSNNSNLNQIPVLNAPQVNNFMSPQPSHQFLVPPYASIPNVIPQQQYPMMNQYMQPTPAFYPPQPQHFDNYPMNGYVQYQQPPMMQQQQQLSPYQLLPPPPPPPSLPPQAPSAPAVSNYPSPSLPPIRVNDADLMDEIFTID